MELVVVELSQNLPVDVETSDSGFVGGDKSYQLVKQGRVWGWIL